MKHTEKFLQQRKLFMALPVLTIPFLTAIFWALGGGKGEVSAKEVDASQLIAVVPEAQFDKNEVWDKFSLYEQAARDSAEFKEARESDPYFDLMAFQEKQSQNPKSDDKGSLIESFRTRDRLPIGTNGTEDHGADPNMDPNEAKVNRKLEELYRELNKSSQPELPQASESFQSSDPQFTEDVKTLEAMMEALHQQPGTDPEMEQLDAMLEKILDIQHPERVKERIKSNSAQTTKQSFQAKPVQAKIPVSQFDQPLTSPATRYDSILSFIEHRNNSSMTNGFYSLEDVQATKDSIANVIEAVVHNEQKVVSGATVTMRLAQEIEIDYLKIPKDQFVYGVCSFSGERLIIKISSIFYSGKLFPVNLSVYDYQGLEGIHVPGAITRDAARQASDDAVQSLQLMSLDNSIQAQAAAAGIEATKGLVSKKSKLLDATLKAGHKIFLVTSN